MMPDDALPADYQALSRTDKEAMLWGRAEASEYPADAMPNRWPGPLDMLKLASSRHDRVSLDHVADEMPPGRVKLLHRYGSVARFEWLARADHPYTGIFRTGGSGLARVSRAVKSHALGLPGMALKIFIDGKPSTNIFAMPSADRDWNDHNPFSLAYMNRIVIGASGRGKFLRAIFDRFFASTIREERTTDLEATFLPLNGLASITPNGMEESAPVHPRLIVFKPTEHAELPTDVETDFRVKLGQLVPGNTLFTINAASSVESEPEHIGDLRLTSRFVACRYSDESLFFQHDRGPTKA